MTYVRDFLCKYLKTDCARFYLYLRPSLSVDRVFGEKILQKSFLWSDFNLLPQFKITKYKHFRSIPSLKYKF